MAKAFKAVLGQCSNDLDINSVIANKFINGATGGSQIAELPKTQQKKLKGSQNDVKKIQVALYLTEEQNEQINSNAKELGMTKSNYMTYLLFKKEQFFSNDDISELLIRARANNVGVKEYIRAELKL